jgi:hypothetical protein
MGKTFGVDFREDVELNKMRLDSECEIQPAMYYHYSSLLSDAKSIQDTAKLKMDYVLGAREMALRTNPPEGIKITEGTVAAMLATDTEVNKAKEEYALATKEVSALYSAVNALEQRKSMLDNLTKLQVSTYYQTTENTGNDIRTSLNKNKE